MPSRVNELRGRKKAPLSKNNRRGRSNTRRKTKKIREREIKEFMKKKIHNIIKFGGNMNNDKIIKELVKDGFKNNTKLQNSVKDSIKELIKEKKIKVDGSGLVYISRYGKRSPSKLRRTQTANNLVREAQNRFINS